jgi:flagellar basal-body rod protein FlgB
MRPVNLFRLVDLTLGGIARRTDVTAHNIANVNTPGYAAQRVSFEAEIARAMASDDTTGAAVVIGRARTLTDPHQGTVDLEGEITTMMKTDLLRNTMHATFNARLGTIRSALSGS